MKRLLTLLAIAAIGLVPGALRGADSVIGVVVRDDAGRPVADAVVYAATSGTAARGGRATMDQENQEFVPHVLPVEVGTAVTFPNRDGIRHHVYSFSPAKRFELPLYTGTPAAPVVFDQAGAVVLGCNIHDWMVAYVYVAPSPHFAKTGSDGRAALRGLPPGPQELRVWHPRLRTPGEAPAQRVTLGADALTVDFKVSLRPERKRPRTTPRYENQQGG
ncbi:MAG: hypothetical protein FJ027_11230 [Candidatus Rokubacteria bacterium]|nr:hypothetical protein [Candidatus Rokubacteria bacterium]